MGVLSEDLAFICDEQNIGRWRVMCGTDVSTGGTGLLIGIFSEMLTVMSVISQSDRPGA